MTGTASQIEWAERIRPQVRAEFDRVARAFQTVAARQQAPDVDETHTVLTILEEKREEVLAHDQAGYFIRDWQEMKDQVRQLIALDPRYKTIRLNRKAREIS